MVLLAIPFALRLRLASAVIMICPRPIIRLIAQGAVGLAGVLVKAVFLCISTSANVPK